MIELIKEFFSVLFELLGSKPPVFILPLIARAAKKGGQE